MRGGELPRSGGGDTSSHFAAQKPPWGRNPGGKEGVGTNLWLDPGPLSAYQKGGMLHCVLKALRQRSLTSKRSSRQRELSADLATTRNAGT